MASNAVRNAAMKARMIDLLKEQAESDRLFDRCVPRFSAGADEERIWQKEVERRPPLEQPESDAEDRSAD